MKKIIISCISLLLLVSCGKKAENVSEQPCYDLSLFDASGPVKSITYQNGFLEQYKPDDKYERFFDNSYETYYFSEDGKWDEEIKPKSIWGDTLSFKVTRKNGNVIEIKGTGDGYAEYSLDFVWDNNNNVIREHWFWYSGGSTSEGVPNATYTSLQNGNILYETSIDWREDGEYEHYEYNKIFPVKILSTDSHGNWTKRRIKYIRNGTYNIFQTRTIEYYE